MHEAVEKFLSEMPRRVKVGAYDYTIATQTEPIETTDEGNVYGLCSHETFTITLVVDDNTTKLQLVGVLLHELNHAIWEERNLGKRPDEEKVVLAYEYGYVCMMRDNPKLFTWFKKGLK